MVRSDNAGSARRMAALKRHFLACSNPIRIF
jgi:hypothetical protein